MKSTELEEVQNGKVQGFFEGEKRSVQLYMSIRSTSKETPQFFIFNEYK